MASSSSSSSSSSSGDSSSRSVLDPYRKFLGRLGLELQTSDVKFLKFHAVKLIPSSVLNQINIKERYAALDLIEQLEEYRIISKNDLRWLKEVLSESGRKDLARKVEEFEIERTVTVNIDDNLETLCLEMEPEFKSHQDNALDLILVIEVPFSVGINDLKNMLKQCQAGVTSLAQQGLDLRLAVITYGDHCAAEASQQSAFISQEFSTDFDFADRIKNERQRGGKGGTSGIADAMAKVVELTTKQKVRYEATKLCLLVNFVVQDGTDLEQYRCFHGYDAIKLCSTLADMGIQLYTLGIHATMPQGGNQSRKNVNYFLEGIAALGSGRYFQLVDVTHLCQAITCVTIHEMCIEMQGKVTGEMIIQEINNNHGVYTFRLPKILEEKLQRKSIGFNAIAENGKPLNEISQIAERVAWANDLDDAIQAVASMKVKPKDNSKTRSLVAQSRADVADPSPSKSKELSAASVQRRVAAKECQEVDHQNTGLCLVEKERVDLEVAERIVRRQLHRMAYFKRSDLKDQNQKYVEKMDIK